MARTATSDDVFRARIREVRKSRGLTQAGLGRLMIDAGYVTLGKNRVGEIETGKRKVSVGEAFAFADVLGVFFEDLVRTAEDLELAAWLRIEAETWLSVQTYLLGPLVDAHRRGDEATVAGIIEEIGKQVDVCDLGRQRRSLAPLGRTCRPTETRSTRFRRTIQRAPELARRARSRDRGLSGVTGRTLAPPTCGTTAR